MSATSQIFEAFRQAVGAMCFWGMCIIALVFIAAGIGRFAKEVRRLGIVGIVAFGFLTVAAWRVSATKTNNVPPLLIHPPLSVQMVNQEGVLNQPGPMGIHPLDEPPETFPPRRIECWWRSGAWEDSLPFAFEDGWVFPLGSNHLSSVEIDSQGGLFTDARMTNLICRLPVPLALVPNGTEVFTERTASNSYAFTWMRGHPNRVADATMDGRLELFRNGDWSVATNGVSEYHARILPFDHDGFGQDAEWVAANFTNAEEILSVGYANWVDAQVGTALTNGLYKFTVTFTNAPPETTLLTVGDYAVAVTNAGEYVFLLKKGFRHVISLSGPCDGIGYSWTDDIPGSPDGAGEPLRGQPYPHFPAPYESYTISIDTESYHGGDYFNLPRWPEGGWIEVGSALIIAPGQYFEPTLPITFSLYFDHWESLVAHWVSDDNSIDRYGESLTLESLDGIGSISVTAETEIGTLRGGINITRLVAQTGIELSSPGVCITEEPYVGAGGSVVRSAQSGFSLSARWHVAEAGNLRLSGDTAAAVTLSEREGEGIVLPHEWTVGANSVGEFVVDAQVADGASPGPLGTFTLEFTPDADAGETLTATAAVTNYVLKVEAAAEWPTNRVRHVFGPGELAKLSFTPAVNSAAWNIDGYGYTGSILNFNAPNHATTNLCSLAISGVSYAFSLATVEPVDVEVVTNRLATADDWGGMAFEVSETNYTSIGMVSFIRVLPEYVSFKGIYLKEGLCTAIPVWGDFTLHNYEIPPHDARQGAERDTVVVAGNIIGNDFAGFALDRETLSLFRGGYKYDIPYRWYTKPLGVKSPENEFCTKEQRVDLYSTNFVSVSKYGFSAEIDALGNSQIRRRE